MALKHISERQYEVFRVDGVKNNSQIPETLTVAVQPEVDGSPVDNDNPLVTTPSTEGAAPAHLLNYESKVLELLEAMLDEQKITNTYLSEGFDDTITKEDIQD